jgi:hypothetical protein
MKFKEKLIPNALKFVSLQTDAYLGTPTIMKAFSTMICIPLQRKFMFY